MKHSIPEFIEVARLYFPEGYWPDGYEASVEYQRRAEAHLRASADYGLWRSMLRRLRQRFPNVEIRNDSIRFEATAATAATPLDRCFLATIELPPRTVHEQSHRLGFRVSFVVPYYFIYSARHVLGTSPLDFPTTFVFTADEADFVSSIEQEIGATFPLHAKMPPDVGMVIVPNVATSLRDLGEATIYDCLFSDYF